MNRKIDFCIQHTDLSTEKKPDIPNETTASAIAEGRALLRDKNAKGYTSMDDLKSALEE